MWRLTTRLERRCCIERLPSKNTIGHYNPIGWGPRYRRLTNLSDLPQCCATDDLTKDQRYLGLLWSTAGKFEMSIRCVYSRGECALIAGRLLSSFS